MCACRQRHKRATQAQLEIAKIGVFLEDLSGDTTFPSSLSRLLSINFASQSYCVRTSHLKIMCDVLKRYVFRTPRSSHACACTLYCKRRRALCVI